MYRLVNLKTLDVLDAVKNRNLRDKKTLKKKNIGYVWFLNNIKEKKIV